jgi:phosphate transport system substrate-binding protein
VPRPRFRPLVVLIAIAAAVPLAAPAGASAAQITISGSTSIFPLASLLARDYRRQGHGGVRFTYTQGGSNIGVDDVAHGRVSVGASSRDPLPSDPGGLTFTRIAYDAVCVISNNQNRIGNIDQAGVASIFSGSVNDWGSVPGAGVRGPIVLEARTAASGTADAFQQIFLGQNTSLAGSADQKSSNGLVQQAVSSNPTAIGYVSLDFTRGVWAIPYNGVRCTLRNAKAKTYTGDRNFWLVTRGAPRGAVRDWIGWVHHNGTALRDIASNWVTI